MLFNRQALLRGAALGMTIEEVANRQTGKTTAAVLRAIAAAIDSPGTSAQIADPDAHHRRQVEHTEYAARRIINQLGLEDMHVSNGAVRTTFAIKV
jgi:hypothetical protein